MPASPDKLDLASLDVAADKRRLLRQLFPEAITETVDAKGRDQLAVDFERLKAVLGEHVELATPGQERYGLEWPGKRDALKAVQASSLATLIPAPEESVDWDTTQNVFIEGDNLEVLKLLQKSYYGKVKMIYIDPPYNTGNDFVYPDNYAESLDTYLRYTGQIDDQGFKTTTNAKDSGRFHSNWLRMMYPRLYVAKNLLREDGVIFISIDDNEVSNLRHLCDQIFGEENFISNVVWQKKYAKQNDTKTVSISHDHILFYARSVAEWIPGKIQRSADQLKGFRNPDSDVRGAWQSVVYTCNKTRAERPNLYYPIINPVTGEESLPDENRVWGFDQARTKLNIQERRLWWGENGELAKPRLKSFLEEVGTGVVPDTLWLRSDVGDNQDAAREILSLFGIPIFDTPKPTTLLERCVKVANCKADDIVVDFFAGSASLADLCYKLGREGHERLKCISIQLPEPVEHDGYKTIADIAKERIRRAGAKIRGEWEEKNAAREAAKARSEEKKSGDLFLESKTLRDFAASREPSSSSLPPDTGFRVFKLAPSNFKRWDGEAAAASKEALVQQMEATLDHIATGATAESLLFEILLKAGYQLTCPMEKLTLAGHTVWSVDGGSLFVCVEDRINSALVDAVAAKHPVQFICLDRALQGNDPLKVNTLETFRAAQPEIQFRTV